MSGTEIDRLYEVPPDEFTAARTALARKLRGGGKKGEAAEVTGRRKPTVAAWAVNQLVRRRRKELRDLFRLGDRLAQLQAKSLSGRGASELRELNAARQDQVAHLVELAREFLEEAGASTAKVQLDRVAATLQAASVDEEAREQVEGGRLERELDAPVGFGAFSVFGGTAPSDLDQEGRKGSSARGRLASRERGQKWEAGREERRRGERARAEAEEMDRRAREAEREAATLREQAGQAEGQAREAKDAARQADRVARETRDAARRAERAAASLRKRADQAAAKIE